MGPFRDEFSFDQHRLINTHNGILSIFYLLPGFRRRRRDGFRSFRVAPDSICLALSRLSSRDSRDSSAEKFPRSLIPKRIRRTFSSRGVRVDRIFRVCSARSILIVASEGDIIFLSSIKSPRWLSSSSPIGVSSEIGSLAIFRTFLTFSHGYSLLFLSLI